jgi:carboxyl-terminal processing protease
MPLFSTGRRLNRAVFVILILTIILVSGGIGARMGSSYYEKIEIFQQVIDHVSDRYVEEYEPGDLVIQAAEALLQDLDEHSQLLTPEDYQELMVDTKGKFGGIGIEIAPIEGTPADRLGIQAGDRIVGIEGESTEGWNTTDAVKRLRGPKGTKVTITVMREGLDETIDFTITRDIINVKSVPYAFMVTPEIGYIRLSTFSEHSADEILESVHQLKDDGCTSLILDLRYNPGGLLTQAIQVSEIFLEKGQTVVSTRGRIENQNQEYTATRDDSETEIPLVVLINQYSASASEIVAGSLQDHDRAVILGKTSFGKGSVQTLFGLEGNYALKLTTALYYTPSGRSIHKSDDLAGPAGTEDDGKPVEYLTDNGRTVYGGGGIKPDLFVEARILSPVEQNLLKKPVFFNYAVHYKSLHDSLPPDFSVDDAVVNDFRQRLSSVEEISLSDDEAAQARDFIDLRLTYEIVRAFDGEAAARKRVVDQDTEVMKAVEVIEKGRDLGGMFALAAELREEAGEPVVQQ